MLFKHDIGSGRKYPGPHSRRIVQARTAKPIRCCDACQRLADRFATEARLYSEAVVKLVLNQKSQDYELLKADVQQAKERCERIGMEFEECVTTHG